MSCETEDGHISTIVRPVEEDDVTIYDLTEVFKEFLLASGYSYLLTENVTFSDWILNSMIEKPFDDQIVLVTTQDKNVIPCKYSEKDSSFYDFNGNKVNAYSWMLIPDADERVYKYGRL